MLWAKFESGHDPFKVLIDAASRPQQRAEEEDHDGLMSTALKAGHRAKYLSSFYCCRHRRCRRLAPLDLVAVVIGQSWPSTSLAVALSSAASCSSSSSTLPSLP
jgi:hypothetical protein